MIKYFQEPGNFNLVIANVSQEDNGTYICQVNTDPPINKVSKLLQLIGGSC